MSEKINAVLQAIKNNSEQQEYFFRNAPKYPNLHLWLEPLCNEGYFDPVNNPLPVEVPNKKGYFKVPAWNVLEFLEAVAIQNRDNHKEAVATKILDIVNNIIDYKSGGDERIDNYRTDWFMVKIVFLMPSDKLTFEHIEFIRTSMGQSRFGSLIDSEIEKIVIPYLLKYDLKEHLLKLIEIMFDYKIDENQHEKNPIIEKYWLHEALTKYSKKIAALIERDGLKLIIGIMQKTIETDSDSFNPVWIVTIEENPQNSFPDRYDNMIITFTRDLLESSDKKDSLDLIPQLLGMEHPIFTRLAIHMMNYHYSDVQSLFWKWFATITSARPFGKHELYELISKHAKEFSEEQMDQILGWIEQLAYGPYEDGEKQANIEAYRRKEWLIPLKSYSPKAQELYHKYHAVYNEEVDHPGFDFWSESYSGHDSPIGSEELDRLEAPEIAQYILEFDPSKHQSRRSWRTGDLKEGLADILTICVKENPDKFLSHLDSFLILEKFYIYHLIFGFDSAWRNKQHFEWNHLFDFFEKLLSDDFFEDEERYTLWIVGAIASLIDDGIRDDTFAFDIDLLDNAKRILLNLFEKTPKDIHEMQDHVTSVLNDPFGKILFALINYSLRVARIGITSSDARWDSDVKLLFSRCLTLKDDSLIAVYVTIGMYLKNLMYLDDKWVFENFHSIFPLDNDKFWNATVEGYFSGGGSVYQSIYNRLKEDGHIVKALNSFQINKDTRTSVIQHICVAYVNDFDDNTIFILDKIDDVKETIWFIWSAYRDEITEAIREKVFWIWNYLFKKYSTVIDEATEQIFSKLSLWFSFIDTIDQKDIALYKLSASLSQKYHNDYWITEELLRLSDQHPTQVADIFLSMLNNEDLPLYPQETIVVLVENFFKKHESKNKAVEICNRYAMQGNYLLANTFEKFNKSHVT